MKKQIKKNMAKRHQVEVEEEKYEYEHSTKFEIKQFAYILIAIFVIIGLAFGLSYAFDFSNNKTKEVQTETTAVETNYSEILGLQSFGMMDEEYYVLFGSASDTDTQSILSVFDVYSGSDDAIPGYFVELGEGFNASMYLDEAAGEVFTTSPESIEELQIAEIPTLVKFSNENGTTQVVEFVQGAENVQMAILLNNNGE